MTDTPPAPAPEQNPDEIKVGTIVDGDAVERDVNRRELFTIVPDGEAPDTISGYNDSETEFMANGELVGSRAHWRRGPDDMVEVLAIRSPVYLRAVSGEDDDESGRFQRVKNALGTAYSASWGNRSWKARVPLAIVLLLILGTGIGYATGMLDGSESSDVADSGEDGDKPEEPKPNAKPETAPMKTETEGSDNSGSGTGSGSNTPPATRPGQPTDAQLAARSDEHARQNNLPPIRTLNENQVFRVQHLRQDAQDPDPNIHRRARTSVSLYRDKCGYNPDNGLVEVHYSFHQDVLQQHPEVANTGIRIRRLRITWSTNLEHNSSNPYAFTEWRPRVDESTGEVYIHARGTCAPNAVKPEAIGVFYAPEDDVRP